MLFSTLFHVKQRNILLIRKQQVKKIKNTKKVFKEIKLIQESLKENNLEIAEKIIIRNIVLNYLSEYLYQEQDKIITLPKTPSNK